MLPTMVREVFGKPTLPREPEPCLVMEDAEQVAAYTHAGRLDGVMAAAYLFHSAQMTAVLSGRKRVVDLGCGPATQLAQLAALNPETEFVGVDLSATMLAQAQAYVAQKHLTNVSFHQADITCVRDFPDGSFDGVISTMALHHLPTYEHLRATYQEMRRLLAPGGAIYLADFGRMKSLKSVIFFAYFKAKGQPHLFILDYERSLRAAFLHEELAHLAAQEFPSDTETFATKFMPILTVTRTPAPRIDPAKCAQLQKMRHDLPRSYRAELDDIRMLFRLGGLQNDPFTKGAQNVRSLELPPSGTFDKHS